MTTVLQYIFMFVSLKRLNLKSINYYLYEYFSGLAIHATKVGNLFDKRRLIELESNPSIDPSSSHYHLCNHHGSDLFHENCGFENDLVRFLDCLFD